MFGHASGPTKNYAYGCLAPTAGGEVALEQLRAARRYYNTLVELTRARTAAIRKALTSPEIANIDARIAEANEDIETVVAAIKAKSIKERRRQASPKIKLLKAHRKELWAKRKEAVAAIKDDPVVQATIKRIIADHYAAQKKARAGSGCHWGTAAMVLRSVPQSGEPKFKRWDGAGLLAIQAIKGCPISGDGESFGIGQFRVERGERTLRDGRSVASWTLKLRVGSNGKEPVWAEFPLVLHRDPPAGSAVKWVYVTRRRLGPNYVWRAILVLERAEGFASLTHRASGGRVAVDIGWRKRHLQHGSSMRAAYWCGDDGRCGELVLDERLIGGLRKVESLQAIRDTHFDQAKAAVLAIRGSAPDWFQEMAQHAHQWRSARKLAMLVRKWKDNRFPGDGVVFDALWAWRTKDRHLWGWQANGRQNILARRRQVYRNFAAWLRARYREVVIERFDLRVFAERAETGEEETQPIQEIRWQRHAAGLSTLRQALRESGMDCREVSAVHTTQRCTECGCVDRDLDADKIVVRCTACGVEIDQDLRACLNLLASDELASPTAVAARDCKPMALHGLAARVPGDDGTPRLVAGAARETRHNQKGGNEYRMRGDSASAVAL